MPIGYPYMQQQMPYGMQQPAYQYTYAPQQAAPNQYMITVDGEVGARAWQMPMNLPPNTVVPLWDVDGEHIYFRTIDAYGRLNPLRKGRIVMEQETQVLPQGQSGDSQPAQQAPQIDTGNFVTKDEFQELKQMIQNLSNQNQNRNRNANQNMTNQGQNSGNQNNQNGGR